MIKINLVPEVQEKKLAIKKVNATVTAVCAVLFGATVILMVILSAINVAKGMEIKKTAERIAAVEEESKQYKELEDMVISLEKGLNGIKEIMNGDNAWTELFTNLEKSTPTEISFDKIKIEESSFELEGVSQTVEGIGKMVDSYKEFKVVVIEGPGTVGETVKITVDTAETQKTVKTNGKWKLSSAFDPSTDHKITVEKAGEKTEITYTAADKKISSTNSALTAEVKKLFTTVEATEYERRTEGIVFKSKMSFDRGALW